MDLRDYIINVINPENSDVLVTQKSYPKGAYIYMPPNKPIEMFQLEKGVVKIGSYTADGEEVCYDFLFKKEFFGNLRYLNGQFFEFAKAVTNCTLIAYDLNYYKHLIVYDPLVSEWFNKMVVERWCRVEARLFKICTLIPLERLIALHDEFDYEFYLQGQKIYLPLLLSNTDIAHLTGLSRQTVSKLLKSYQRMTSSDLFKYQKINRAIKFNL